MLDRLMAIAIVLFLHAFAFANVDISKSPEIILHSNFSFDKLSLHGVFIGDGIAKIPSDSIVSSDTESIRCKNEVGFEIVAGRVVGFWLGKSFTKKLGLNNTKSIKMKLGPADKVLSLRGVVKTYIYRKKNLAISITPLFQNQSTLKIGSKELIDKIIARNTKQLKFHEHFDKGAKYFFQQKNYELAAKELSKAISYQPENVPARLGLAKAYHFSDRPDKAMEEYNLVIAILSNPGSLDDTAEEVIELIGSRKSSLAEAYNGKAFLYLDISDTLAAIESLEKVMEYEVDEQKRGMCERLLLSLVHTRSVFSEATKKEIYGVFVLAHKLTQVVVAEDKSYKPPGDEFDYAMRMISDKYGIHALKNLTAIMDEGRLKNWRFSEEDLLVKLAFLMMRAERSDKMPQTSDFLEMLE